MILGQTCQKSNLIYITSGQINIPNFKSISHETREKSPENYFLQRAITQLKVGKTRQKFKLTCITSRQIHIRSTKFQVNISKDDCEKWKTEWTDTEWTDGQTNGPTE